MAWSLACAATISRWTPASTSFASARVRPKSAMSTRPSGRLISTTSAHDPSPSAPISTSLKTQATYPPSVRERARNTRPPSHPQSRDGPVTGQVVPVNPAASVRGPRHIVREGKTPVLGADEARQLLDSIDVSTAIGLRDRALIGLMAYSFARIGAASDMKVEDVYTQNRRLWVRLREKGGKAHAMPCHHNLEEYLTAYLDGTGLRNNPKRPLFPTIGRRTSQLTETALPQANAYAMIGRRAAAAEISTRLGNHSFRATGITTY